MNVIGLRKLIRQCLTEMAKRSISTGGGRSTSGKKSKPSVSGRGLFKYDDMMKQSSPQDLEPAKDTARLERGVLEGIVSVLLASNKAKNGWTIADKKLGFNNLVTDVLLEKPAGNRILSLALKMEQRTGIYYVYSVGNKVKGEYRAYVPSLGKRLIKLHDYVINVGSAIEKIKQGQQKEEVIQSYIKKQEGDMSIAAAKEINLYLEKMLSDLSKTNKKVKEFTLEKSLKKKYLYQRWKRVN